jgi:hypothetical protein
MMQILIYAVIVVALIGAGITLALGHSRENKEGNPDYDRNSVPNWRRLSLLYVVGTAVFLGIMVWVMKS